MFTVKDFILSFCSPIRFTHDGNMIFEVSTDKLWTKQKVNPAIKIWIEVTSTCLNVEAFYEGLDEVEYNEILELNETPSKLIKLIGEWVLSMNH